MEWGAVHVEQAEPSFPFSCLSFVSAVVGGVELPLQCFAVWVCFLFTNLLILGIIHEREILEVEETLSSSVGQRYHDV